MQHAVKINNRKLRSESGFFHGWVVTILYSSIFPFYIHSDSGTPIRWLIYLLPVFSFIIWMLISKSGILRVDLRYLLFSLGFLFLIIISNYMAPLEYVSVQEILFIFGAVAVFVPKFLVNDNMVKVLLFSNMIAMVYHGMVYGFENEISFDLTQSQGAFENSYGLTIPVIAIYFYLRKNFLYFFLAILLSFLAYKRIAIGSLIISIIYLSIVKSRLIGFVDRKSIYKFALLLATGIFSIVFLVAINFTYIIDFLFNTGIITDRIEVTSGRYNMMKLAEFKIESRNWLLTAIGAGPGQSTVWVKSMQQTGFPFLLNDWLRVVYDYGYIGLALWLFFILRVFGQSWQTLSLFISISIIAITDGAFMYFIVMFSYFIVGRAIEQNAVRYRT